MHNFNFVATEHLDLKNLNDFDTFVNKFEDFQGIFLKDEKELKLLLKLIGIEEFIETELKESVFSKMWDISSFKLPEFTSKEYEKFYLQWIQLTKRENNMNEYGNLIFLQGKKPVWNKSVYRIILHEPN